MQNSSTSSFGAICKKKSKLRIGVSQRPEPRNDILVVALFGATCCSSGKSADPKLSSAVDCKNQASSCRCCKISVAFAVETKKASAVGIWVALMSFLHGRTVWKKKSRRMSRSTKPAPRPIQSARFWGSLDRTSPPPPPPKKKKVAKTRRQTRTSDGDGLGGCQRGCGNRGGHGPSRLWPWGAHLHTSQDQNRFIDSTHKESPRAILLS